MPMKGILAIRTKFPSEKEKHQILASKFGKQIRDGFPSLNGIQTGSTNGDLQVYHSMTSDLQSGFEEQGEFARHIAYPLLQRRRNTAIGSARHSKERMYVVDRERLVTHEWIFLFERRRLFDCQAKIGIFRPPNTQAKVYIKKELGAYLLEHLVEDSPSLLSLGRLCNELGCSFSWHSGEAPRLSNKR